MGHQQRDLLQYLASIAKIEHAIQIDFFPDLPACSKILRRDCEEMTVC